MTPIELLHDEGQALWLDHVTRETIACGALTRAIDHLGVTGVVFDPARLHRAIDASRTYDAAILCSARCGKSPERSLFELALADAVRAADLLRQVWGKSSGADGFVSVPLSPLLSATPEGTLAVASEFSDSASRSNLLVEIPGSDEGFATIENAIFAGIPVNVTALLSVSQYRRAADAYLRGLERRAAAGFDLEVDSVASLLLAPWDAHDASHRLGIEIGKHAYKEYRALLRSPRWQRLFRIGARPQRILWAGLRTANDAASDLLYARALAAPFTVTALPLGALQFSRALLSPVPPPVSREAGDATPDVETAAAQLQREVIGAACSTWRATILAIASKSAALDRAS